MIWKFGRLSVTNAGIKPSASLKRRLLDFTIVKTLLNDLWTHIGYEDDGRLVYTDKKTGVQKISLKAWFDTASAKKAVDAGFSKIEWRELKEPPPAA